MKNFKKIYDNNKSNQHNSNVKNYNTFPKGSNYEKELNTNFKYFNEFWHSPNKSNGFELFINYFKNVQFYKSDDFYSSINFFKLLSFILINENIFFSLNLHHCYLLFLMVYFCIILNHIYNIYNDLIIGNI